MRIYTVVVLSLLPWLSINMRCAAELLPDWPEFRGPTGQGIAANADPPLTWSQTENVVWKRAIPGRGWSSPIVYGGSIYLTTALEETPDRPMLLRAIRVDARSGKEIWKETLMEGARASASPVLANGRVYQTLENGCTVVFEPGSGFEKLAENPLGQYTLASPAVSGRALFIRTESHLYRIEQSL